MQLFQLEFNPVSFAALLGFLAVGAYILTLLPTTLRIVFPATTKTGIPKWLLKYRRWIGLLSFCLAVGHAYIYIKQRNFDWLDIKTYWFYFQGTSTLTIFTLLAITSNDWSVKRLKKNWKKLQQLTYWAMFLLTWHIWAIMAHHWTYLTPFGMVSMFIIIILFLYRQWIVHHQSNSQKPGFCKKI